MAALGALSLINLLHGDRNVVHSTFLGESNHHGTIGDGEESFKFTAFAKYTVTCAWIITFLTGIIIAGLSVTMPSTKRQFHQVAVLVQAVALLGYSTAIGGYGIFPQTKGGHVLIGSRDEYIFHYLLPCFCFPPIVYLMNNMAGLFFSEGCFIIATLFFSTIYGAVSLFLPRDWLGSFVAVLSVIFAVPYLVALVSTWPSSVKAAPKRVRKVLKTCCAIQVVIVGILLVTFDLAVNETISVDVENLILTVLDVTLYSVIPLLLVFSKNVLKDVYSREEYIKQTKRASSISVPPSLTPHLIPAHSTF